MKISLHAVGRMKKGPERDLFDRYFDRARAVGKNLNMVVLPVKEHAEGRGQRPLDRKAQEARDLLSHIDDKAYILALDERGKSISSSDFAKLIEKERDCGRGHFCLMIGGADGFDGLIRERADQLISFGAMTWPHQMVRIMAAEQIYRSFCIVSGHPYHKI